MTNFKNWLNVKVVPAFARMATQRHLLAIRNGIVQILPFVIAGSIGLIVISFPIGTGAGDTLGSKMSDKVNLWIYWIFKWNFSLLGLIAGIAVGSELAKSYRLNPTIGSTLSAASLFFWILPSVVTTGSVEGGDYAVAGGRWLDINNDLGAGVMLGSVLSAILAVEIYRIVVKYNITIKLPSTVPPQVAQAFIAITPAIAITFLFISIRTLIGFDLRIFMTTTLQPLGDFVTDNMGGALLVTFLISVTWWFGINLSGMINGMVRPFWLAGLETNQEIHAGEATGEYKVYVEQFNQSFTQAGGSGASLGMVLAILIFAKSKENRAVGFVSLAPGLFNINEPLIFGYPIMLNPYFVIPFIATPIVLTITAGILVPAFGITFIAAAPWTMPTPIFALLATGMQWQAAVLSIITIAISVGIYAPFVIFHDRATGSKTDEAAAVTAKA